MSNWVKEASNTLMIVDCSNLAFRFFKNPAGMKEGLLNTIMSFKASYSAKDVVVLFDKGKSSYRMGIYPEYKGNRDKAKVERTEEEKAKWDNFFEAQAEATERLYEAGLTVICEYGVEADDVAAYLSKTRYNQYDHIKLLSTDADWLQLLNDKVSIFAYVQQIEKDVQWLVDNLDCTPDQFLMAKIIAGDTGDNIFGVQGLGEPKKNTARSLKWAKSGETIDEILTEAANTKGVIAKRLADSRDLLELNVKLIDLSIDGILTDAQISNIEESMNGCN